MLRRDFLAALPLTVKFARLGRGSWAPLQTATNILQYGAKPDGRTPEYQCNSARDRGCLPIRRRDGYRAYRRIPHGAEFQLKSRVTLKLEEGVLSWRSTSIADFDAESDHAGNQGTNPRHLIFAMNADDVALSGPGRIDGEGSTFLEPSGKAPLPEDQQWADVASHDLEQYSN